MIFKSNKEKGNDGLGIAIAYYSTNGYTVSIPLNDTQDYDLIVDKNNVLKKVQVKATSCKTKYNKYQVALIDGETHEVVDILECRHKHFLCDYFKKFPKSELDNVKYFVTDLWETYKDIAFTYFRKAKIVADHFYFARYACDAVNKIRIQHWYCEIKNSLEVPYSNGPTEGFNNKIKVLKRISFGVRNFTNFKARIMLLNRE